MSRVWNDDEPQRIAADVTKETKDHLRQQQAYVRGVDYTDDEKDALREEVKVLRKRLAEVEQDNAEMRIVIEQLRRELGV
jgi:hypothetical protein